MKPVNAAGPWIQVTERPPLCGTPVLFVDKWGTFYAGTYESFGWICVGDHNPEGGTVDNVTHWAALSPPTALEKAPMDAPLTHETGK